MANVLIIRLSAIGDVAMTVPVIYSAARANPQHHFTVLTQAFLMPVFMNNPPNVEVIGINTKASEKSLTGLLKFASALVKYDYDVVLDLHDVIRSRIVRTLFKLNRKKVYVLDKQRKARKQLVAEQGKKFQQIRPVVAGYADVFRQAGFDYTDSFTSLFQNTAVALTDMHDFTGVKNGRWIGIAPFAKHPGKIYPQDKMEKVVAELSKDEQTTIFLFGGRGYEQAILEEWAFQYPRVKSVAGRYSLDKELMLISQLDLLLCMDSANMHFASLAGTRVVSIWGATHPYAGFYGYGQNPEDAIQAKLDCRPCSIYGQKPCLHGDWACLKQIKPEQITEKINAIL